MLRKFTIIIRRSAFRTLAVAKGLKEVKTTKRKNKCYRRPVSHITVTEGRVPFIQFLSRVRMI